MPKQPEQQSQKFLDLLSPTEQVKRDIIQLARDSTDHLSKSLDSLQEKWAFYVKTKVLALRIENYTPIPERYWLLDLYKEMNAKVEQIDSSDLSPENKKINRVNILFNYSLRVYDMALKVLHNSPIVETRSEGVVLIDENDEKKLERIRKTRVWVKGKKEPVLSYRQDSKEDDLSEIVIEQKDDETEEELDYTKDED